MRLTRIRGNREGRVELKVLGACDTEVDPASSPEYRTDYTRVGDTFPAGKSVFKT